MNLYRREKEVIPKEHELLGNVVEDVYTGFRGRAVGHFEYLYGCNRIHVEPTSLLLDGTVEDNHVFDVQRLKIVEKLDERIEPVLPTTPLGSRVRHKYTGFEGIVTALATWINHVPQVDIEPTGRGKNGEMMRGLKFDEQDVELIEKLGIKDTTATTATTATEKPHKKRPKKPGGPRDSWECTKPIPSR